MTVCLKLSAMFCTAKSGNGSFDFFLSTYKRIIIHLQYATSYNIKEADHIEENHHKRNFDKIISDIEYDEMETKLHRFDDYDEEITFGRFGGLCRSVRRRLRDASITIIAQPDEPSSIFGPVEMKSLADDVFAAPPPKQVVTVEEHIDAAIQYCMCKIIIFIVFDVVNFIIMSKPSLMIVSTMWTDFSIL